jgi:adenosyl cobinamide kinase/adenosyl cobinamide phosphate guanylyltransferase
MADAVLDERPVLFNLQDMISKDPGSGDILLAELIKKQVVICNEVGSGVIPAERREREAREKTGRLCILLAQKAEKVVRLVSGIPTILKEKP